MVPWELAAFMASEPELRKGEILLGGDGQGGKEKGGNKQLEGRHYHRFLLLKFLYFSFDFI